MMNGKHEPDINTEEQKLSEVVQTVDTEIKPLKAFFTKFNHDWSLTLARALAYNLLTAIFPIALAMLSILGIVVGALDPHVQDDLIARLQTIFPSVISSGDVIRTILHQLSKISGVLGIIAVVLAIFTGSRLFLLIERCFNIIYRLPPRSFLSKNLVAIGMLLLFILLVPIMIFASSAPAFVLAFLKNTPLGNAPGSGFFFTLVSILSSLLVAMILFQAIYMIIPNRRISFSKSWPGALVAAVALQIFLIIFPLYATRFLGGFIGQVGFAIILLAFFYYFGLILLLGAEVNAFFFEHVRSKTDDLAELVYAAANKGGGDQPAASPASPAPNPQPSGGMG